MDNANARALSDPPAANASATGAVSHIRPVEARPRNTKFAAVGEEISRILGPHRGAKLIYGHLASAWFEYADPKKIAERNGEYKRQITPGDWVSVDYKTFFAITGTNSKDSIARWIRILTEDVHECPWPERCPDEHPLVVFKRQGHGKPNRYRKWRCGEDERVLHEPITSPKLKAAAQEREVRKRRARAAELDVVLETGPELQQELGFLKSDERTSDATHDRALEVRATDFIKPVIDELTPSIPEVRRADFFTSDDRTSGSPPAVPHEARLPDAEKSDKRTCLRENTPNTDSVGNTSSPKTTAKREAADFEEIDEIDAVACEAIELILELARRRDPEYPESRGWVVARKLAEAALSVHLRPADARGALSRAIASPKISTARNPIGFLVRGILGDEHGDDRFLLLCDGQTGSTNSERIERTEAKRQLAPGLEATLIEYIRDGKTPSSQWLRERDLTAVDVESAKASIAAGDSQPSELSLVDRLEASDLETYERGLNEMRATITFPDIFGKSPSLAHPIVRGMCRAALERHLESMAGTEDS